MEGRRTTQTACQTAALSETSIFRSKAPSGHQTLLQFNYKLVSVTHSLLWQKSTPEPHSPPPPPYIMPQIGAMYSKGGCSLHNSFKQFYLFWACCLSWHYTQCWCTGDDDLTGAECSDLFYDVSQFHQTLTATTSIISCCITSLNGLIFCYRLMQLKGSVKEPNKFPERTE